MEKPESSGSLPVTEGKDEVIEITNFFSFSGSPKASPTLSPMKKACLLTFILQKYETISLYSVPNKNRKDLAFCLHKIASYTLGGYC
jgi:hypothetical protein